MDLSAPQTPYIMGAFIFAGGVIAFLTFWTLWADRKARQSLKKGALLEKRQSDEA